MDGWLNWPAWKVYGPRLFSWLSALLLVLAWMQRPNTVKIRRKSSNLYLRCCRVSEAPAERPEVRPEEARLRCQASASDKVCLHVCDHYKQAWFSLVFWVFFFFLGLLCEYLFVHTAAFASFQAEGGKKHTHTAARTDRTAIKAARESPCAALRGFHLRLSCGISRWRHAVGQATLLWNIQMF